MKRILSIIITVAMLMSSIGAFAAAYPADKASAYVLDSSFDGKEHGDIVYSINGATNVTGVYGKAADDVSGLFAEGSESAYYYLEYKHGEPIYLDNGAELDGYLVVEYNFKPVDNDFVFAQIAVSTRQHSVSEQIRPTTSGYNIYGWNHVKWVYDPTGHGDFAADESGSYDGIAEGTVLGTTTTYLNGVKLGEDKVISTTSTTNYNMGAESILIQIYSGDKSNVHSAYIDDVKIYKTTENTAPVTAEITAGNTFTVSGTNIAATSATTVADIAAANPSLASVAAYKDADMKNKLADDEQIDIDNYVVAKSTDGLYTTYKVADPMEASYLVNITDGIVDGAGVTIARLTSAAETGVGGKASYDAAAKLTYNANGSTDLNGYVSYQGYTNDGTHPYFVAEFNYYPDTATNLFMYTAQNVPVAKSINVGSNGIVAKQWNKILLFIDYSGDYPVARVFANGVEIEGCKVEHSDSTKNIFGVNKNEIRIGYISNESAALTAYVDDLKMYETDVAPTAADTAAPKLVSNDKVEIATGVIKTALGTSVADLDTDVTADVYAYVDGAATDMLVDGAEVVVIGKNAAIGYYKVKVDEETNMLVSISNLADIEATKTAVVRATASEVTGFGGKDASDASVKLVQNGSIDSSIYSMYIQNNWGTVVDATDTEAATWDKADYTGYLVYEANIYIENITSLKLQTNNGQAITGEFIGGLTAGRWCKVVAIVNETGDANDGKAIVYVDGEVAADWTDHKFGTESGKTLRNNIRLVATGIKYDKEADTSAITDFGTMYIDDIKIYETTVMPVVKQEEAVTAIVSEGITSSGTLIRGTVETVDGFAGKTAENSVYKITRTEESPNESDAFHYVTWNRKLDEAKYLVFESDIYSDSNYGGAYYATKGHAPVGTSGRIANGILGADKWNRYVTVVDIDNGYTADTYMNGVLVEEDIATPFMSAVGYNVIRTVFPLEIGESVYCDNYRIYETNKYPEIEMSSVVENGIYENGVVTDNYLYVVKGTTVDEAAVMLYSGAIVYTDSTLTTEELGSAEVYNGLVAAVIDAENDLYYSRKIVVIDAVPELDQSEFVILGADSGSTMEPVTVVANMAAGDVFVMKQDTVQNVTEVNEDGETVTTVEEGIGTRELIIAEEDGIEISTIVPQAENGKLRAFMIDNLTSIRPLGGQTVIECPFPVVEVEAK